MENEKNPKLETYYFILGKGPFLIIRNGLVYNWKTITIPFVSMGLVTQLKIYKAIHPNPNANQTELQEEGTNTPRNHIHTLKMNNGDMLYRNKKIFLSGINHPLQSSLQYFSPIYRRLQPRLVSLWEVQDHGILKVT